MFFEFSKKCRETHCLFKRCFKATTLLLFFLLLLSHFNLQDFPILLPFFGTPSLVECNHLAFLLSAMQ